MRSHIEYLEEGAIVSNTKTAYTYAVAANPRDFESYRTNTESLDWKSKDFHIADWRIHPYGDNNNLPIEIRDIVQNNSDAPGAIKKKVQMLWGKGPKLYSESFDENGELIKNWSDDKEVTDWLESWDYEDYLTKVAVDFTHMEGCFSKVLLYKGARVDKKNKIAKLKHVSIDKARLASKYKKELTEPTHVVVTDFRLQSINALIDMDVYPKYDFQNPFASRVSILYSNMHSFCQDYYTVPDIYGALEWLRRSNAIPIILKALSKNSLNVRFHVESSQEYWDQEEKRIKDRCTAKGIDYKESMLLEFEKKILGGIAEVLSGEENVGKFWHTKKILMVDGTNLLEHGWKITPIDQKIKDYIAAQISISNHASQKVNSSIGVHSSLSNTGEKGKVDSGGEQYTALHNYLATGIDIPEMIVTKAINYALKVNFPTKGLKLGFYHVATKRLAEVTPSQRPDKD